MSLVSLASGFILDQAVGAGVDAALSELLAGRRRDARDRLVRRLSQGKTISLADDAAAAAIFTYMRAAEEGAARRNLELMADFLARSAAEPDYAPNEFRRHARHLADLSRAEALALAVMTKSEQLTLKDDPWRPVVDYAISTSGYFKSRDEFTAACGALVRTGWVVPLSLYGSIGYAPTVILADVARLLDVEGAIRRAEAEGVES